jgi:hypothetical protein
MLFAWWMRFLMVSFRERAVTPNQMREGAGLIPDASAYASAERRCKKDGNDHYGDDSGTGDEQSAIHG